MFERVFEWILGIVLLFYGVAALWPTLNNSLTNLSAAGVPLASFFSASGIIPLIIIFAVVIMVVRGMKSNSGKSY